MTATRTGPPSPELLSITTAQTDAGVRICVTGEVDCSTAPRLTSSVESALTGAPRELVVDLAGVTFLDSAGLHALVSAHTRAHEAGARLRVLVATHAALRPIQVTGLWDVLGVEVVQPGAGVA